MDLFSRYVLSWKLSNTLDTVFCTEALGDALRIGKPDISNTDQGAQFTSNAYIEILKANDIQISMDSRGRAMDNIFVERLWRSLKYEDIYINNYESPRELQNGLTRYFELYNNERLHEALDYKTPWEVHFGIGITTMGYEISCCNVNKELILPDNAVMSYQQFFEKKKKKQKEKNEVRKKLPTYPQPASCELLDSSLLWVCG